MKFKQNTIVLETAEEAEAMWEIAEELAIHWSTSRQRDLGIKISNAFTEGKVEIPRE